MRTPGETSRSIRFEVEKIDLTLEIKASTSSIEVGRPVTLQVALEPAPTLESRVVRIYGYTAEGRRLLAEVEVDEAGSVAVELRPDHTTTFEAVRPEDDLHAVATARVRVSVQAQVDGELRGFYAMSSGTALYHPGENPRYHLHVAPNSTGMAATIELQRRTSDGWRRMARVSLREGGASC